MESLEAELERARGLSVAEIADAVESVGFECTRCGACCKGETAADGTAEPHTATVFPDEVRELEAATGGGNDRSDGGAVSESPSGSGSESGSDSVRDWRDVARPMPYGLTEGEDGPEGETFEWALQTDACGDCAFYAEDEDGTGACTVHENRPLICETYPFSVALGGTSQPMGEAVGEVALGGSSGEGRGGEPGDVADGDAGESDDAAGGDGYESAAEGDGGDDDVRLRAHECEGLGRDIDRERAEELADALKRRAVRELEEAIRVRENYEPVPDAEGVVVHDSEGAKRPDGTPL